jgi:lactate racemase
MRQESPVFFWKAAFEDNGISLDIFGENQDFQKMNWQYGNDKLALDLPDWINWQVLQKALPVSSQPQSAVIQRGIDNLISQLSSRIGANSRLLLIVPDHTRKCNLPAILSPLLDALEKQFAAQIEILIANGSHVEQPADVVTELLTPEIYHRYTVTQHNSQKNDELVYLGKTTYGTEIRLNRKVKEADFIITIGGILYHYFAGFGGGPKMLLPGVAGYEAIRQNHSRTIDPHSGGFHPRCFEGNINDNPVYDDLVQVLNVVENVLSLQVVLSPREEIVLCEAGPIMETQQKLIKSVEQIYTLPIREKTDVVIADAGGWPSDVNLIQAHKSIHHAFQAVKPGGCLLVIAECREGIGSKTFLPVFQYGNAQAIGRALTTDYQINSHTALSFREKADQVRLILLTSLDRNVVEKTGAFAAANINEAMNLIARLCSNARSGFLFPLANLYLPALNSFTPVKPPAAIDFAD